MNLTTFAATFEVEEECTPDFGSLLAEVEMRLRQLEGVHGVSADVAASTRRFAVVVEVEGEHVDLRDAECELEWAIRDLVKRFVMEPVIDDPLVDEVEE